MSDVRDKIRKLLAMATHERSNEHEAETAMRQAEALMRQHNIDAAELEAATGKRTVHTWASIKIAIGEKAGPARRRPLWINLLMTEVSTYCDCQSVWSTDEKYGHCVKFMGDEADIEYCAWLFKKLRDHGYAESHTVDRKHRDTFRKAYAIRLCHRMRTIRAERDAAMKAATTKTGNALMVVQDKLALRDAEFGKPEGFRTVSVRFASDGFKQGRAAANAVNFNRPIGMGGHPSNQLLP